MSGQRARSSGDLLADRRFAWGEAAAAEMDFAAAIDLFEQTVERAPDWAPAWMALGEARAKLGRREEACMAFTRVAKLDPEDELGASLRLALLEGTAPSIAPPAYVRDLFEQYAPRFDAHLVGSLAYRGPAILRDAVERACVSPGRPPRFSTMLDLGCGTGLAAREFAPFVDYIDGVDLAPAMIIEAEKTGLYRRLVAGDLIPFLEAARRSRADLVIAADVFVYVGDLAPVMAACAGALAPEGLLAFTCQRAEESDWTLGEDLRFAHAVGYARREAASTGLDIVLLEEASTRRDGGVDVPGFVCVCRKPPCPDGLRQDT